MLVGPALPKRAVGVATYHSVFSTGPLLDTFSPLIRWSLAKLDAHIVVSEACVGSLAPYFPLPLPRDPERHRRPPLLAPRPSRSTSCGPTASPSILFLGRFDPRNGLGTMLDAFTRVHRELSGDGAPVRRRRRAARQVLPPPGARATSSRHRLGGPGRLDAAALLRERRHPLHPLQQGILRHGPARGDELRRGRSWPAASRASSSSWSTARQGLLVRPGRRRRALRPRAPVPARPAGRAGPHGPRGPADGRQPATPGRRCPASSSTSSPTCSSTSACAWRTGMTKRALIVRFAVSATVVVLAGAAGRLARARAGWRRGSASGVMALAVVIVALAAWASLHARTASSSAP